MLRLGIAFKDGEQIQALPGGEEQVVGFFDDGADVGLIEVAIDVIQADQHHEVKRDGRTAKQGEDFPAVEVMEGVDGFLADERMTFGLQKNPQAAIGFLDCGDCPVGWNLLDVSGVEILQDRGERLFVVLAIPLQYGEVFAELNMLDAEHGDGIGAKMVANEIKSLFDVRGGHDRFGQNQKVQFLEVAGTFGDHLENRADLLPFVPGVGQLAGILSKSHMIGDLAHHAMLVMSQGEFDIDLLFDNFEHGDQ